MDTEHLKEIMRRPRDSHGRIKLTSNECDELVLGLLAGGADNAQISPVWRQACATSVAWFPYLGEPEEGACRITIEVGQLKLEAVAREAAAFGWLELTPNFTY